MWKWFLAIYLITESKKGISAKQLQRMLGGSYKTAWYLSHRIRDAMGDAREDLLIGIVEADETWVGGKHKASRAAARSNRQMSSWVPSQRDGSVRLRVARDRRPRDRSTAS